MKKNVASQRIGAQMVSATDGSAFTGSVTVYVCGDAGTQAVGSVGSGACAHEGNGYHTYAPAQAETNYDLIAFTFIGTGAIPATVQVFANFPQTGDGYAIVNNGTYGNSAIENLVDDLESRLTATRAGYLDNLSAGAVPTAASIASAVWASVIEGSFTALQTVRLFLSVMTGKSSNGGKTFRDTGDTKDRLAYTIDGSGNRTAVTRDGS